MSKKNAFWKSLDERIRGAGGTPGDYNFAADILDMAANESDGWTKRSDDAIRIPDMIGDAARYLRNWANTDEETLDSAPLSGGQTGAGQDSNDRASRVTGNGG